MLWAQVREEYIKETPTRDPTLAREVTCIRDALGSFRAESRPRYVIVDFLGVGGAGIVFKTWDTVLRTYRALKVARPIEGKEDLVAGLLSEEISRLQEVSHPNVIAIFDAGHLHSTSGELPYYTMTFLRGALPANKYFARPCEAPGRTPNEIAELGVKRLLEFIGGFLAGIEHIHAAHLVHLDLKPSNVFVGEDGYAVVADLGGARQLQGSTTETLIITCTSGYAHPKLLGLTAVSSTGGDDNRRRGRLRRSDLHVAFDLFATGRTLMEIIHRFEAANPKALSAYVRKYLMLQAARLLDGETVKSERPLGLTEASLAALKYKTATAALRDFNKLVGKANPLEEIPELSPTNDRVIQVVRGQKTSMTARLQRLLDEPLLRRLATVSQLGLVRLVYPGATHSRLEHSLGTYSNAAQYITALYNDPINPLFRQIITKGDLVATLLAALLHDVGQYQHAHDLEDVEAKVFKHETLTSALLKGEHVDFQPLTNSLRKRITEDWQVKPERLVAILEAKPDNLSTDLLDRLLHTIVSGPLDADKLDYLIRDSNHCQTVFGRGLDRARLLSTLTVVYERRGTRQETSQYFAVGIHEKGQPAAESLSFIRFQMYKAVYWHHAVRAAKAMIQRAAYEWIAGDGRTVRDNDRFKRELYEFVLQIGKNGGAEPPGQSELFDAGAAKAYRIGNTVRPQWSVLNNTDLLALDWLYAKTTEVGKRLVDALAVRKLYKRIFVVSASLEPSLWTAIHDGVGDHERLRERSKELRKALKKKADDAVRAAAGSGQHFQITGIGEDDDSVARAADALGLEGSVLIDVARRRDQEVLRFYPEDLFRGQREEFEDQPVTAVSELWKLLSERLHETAGSIRVFAHPDIDVLRTARLGPEGKPILGSETLQEELRTVFGL